MTLLTLWWGCVAVLAYVVVWVLTAWALRPKSTTVDPDWFYGGPTSVSWVQSIDPTKPEPTDRPESKPESGAG